MQYFDFIPDDILIYHIFNHLRLQDKINLSKLESFNKRDEIWKYQVKKFGDDLYNKKEYYQQSWHNYYVILTNSAIIPLYYHGDIINHIPFIPDKYEEYLFDPNNINSDKIFVFLKRHKNIPNPMSYIDDSVKYEIMAALLIENNKVVDKYINYSKNAEILKVILINPDQYKLGNNKDTLPKISVELGNYEINMSDIENELFYRYNVIPIYASGYLNKNTIIDYSNIADTEILINGKEYKSFFINELIVILAKLYNIININYINIVYIDNTIHINEIKKLLELKINNNNRIGLNFKYTGKIELHFFIVEKLKSIGHYHDWS